MQNKTLLSKRNVIIVILTFVFGVLSSFYIYDSLQNGGNTTPNIETPVMERVSYKGRIQYIDPGIYPEDEITHVLLDSSNKEVILLKSEDQKLPVAEGLTATLYGTLGKTVGGEDYLLVDEIVISNSK